MLAFADVCANSYYGAGRASLIERAYAMAESGEYETAVRSLEKALERRPADPDLHDALADLLDALGRTDDALVHRSIYARISCDPEAKWKLAQAYASAKQYDWAIAVLNESIRMGTANELTYRFLAFCYDRSGARALAEKARAVAESLARESKPKDCDSEDVVQLKQYM